jgi:hypothetical protein
MIVTDRPGGFLSHGEQHVRRRRVLPRLTGLAMAILAFLPIATGAQTPEQRATRAELKSRSDSLSSVLASSSVKGKQRESASRALQSITSRLEAGDFRVGDRVVLSVTTENTVGDTAVVREGLMLPVKGLPDLALTGVLRSELEAHLVTHVARYLRNATAHATSLTRLNVTGAIGRPGYYYLAPDRPISEVLTAAGGSITNSNMGKISVLRNGQTIVDTKRTKAALREGRTLEELDVQSGDEVRIPTARKFNANLIVQTLFIVSSLSFAFVQFLQWYYREQ